ncbi:MAG: N-acetyltransferase family protein [Candidatus Kapaibacterium sp.]
MFTIDRVTSRDLTELYGLLEELAAYERLQPPDADARKRLEQDILGDSPRLDAFLLRSDGVVAGYLLLLATYSSFRAQPTLYIEDIYLREEFRRMGLGSKTLRFVLEEARRRSCGRIEWQVLDWNTPAVSFYEKIGAERMSGWSTFRVSQEQFDDMDSRLTTEG